MSILVSSAKTREGIMQNVNFSSGKWNWITKTSGLESQLITACKIVESLKDDRTEIQKQLQESYEKHVDLINLFKQKAQENPQNCQDYQRLESSIQYAAIEKDRQIEMLENETIYLELSSFNIKHEIKHLNAKKRRTW